MAASKYVVWDRYSSLMNLWQPYSPDVTHLLERCLMNQLSGAKLSDADPYMGDVFVNLIEMKEYANYTSSAVRRVLYAPENINKGYCWQYSFSGYEEDGWRALPTVVQQNVEFAWFFMHPTVDLHAIFPHVPLTVNLAKGYLHISSVNMVCKLRRIRYPLYPTIKTPVELHPAYQRAVAKQEMDCLFRFEDVNDVIARNMSKLFVEIPDEEHSKRQRLNDEFGAEQLQPTLVQPPMPQPPMTQPGMHSSQLCQQPAILTPMTTPMLPSQNHIPQLVQLGSPMPELHYQQQLPVQGFYNPVFAPEQQLPSMQQEQLQLTQQHHSEVQPFQVMLQPIQQQQPMQQLQQPIQQQQPMQQQQQPIQQQHLMLQGQQQREQQQLMQQALMHQEQQQQQPQPMQQEQQQQLTEEETKLQDAKLKQLQMHRDLLRLVINKSSLHSNPQPASCGNPEPLPKPTAEEPTGQLNPSVSQVWPHSSDGQKRCYPPVVTIAATGMVSPIVKACEEPKKSPSQRDQLAEGAIPKKAAGHDKRDSDIGSPEKPIVEEAIPQLMKYSRYVERVPKWMQPCIACNKLILTDNPNSAVAFRRCSHIVHEQCFLKLLKRVPLDVVLPYPYVYFECPLCGAVYGRKVGNQPEGTMMWTLLDTHLQGYEEVKTIEIVFRFQSGVQEYNHPRPGNKYFAVGFPRTYHLPNNYQGRLALLYMKLAFERRLMFTIGSSNTTGKEDVVQTCISLKSWGNPDQAYLQRIIQQLVHVGVAD